MPPGNAADPSYDSQRSGQASPFADFSLRAAESEGRSTPTRRSPAGSMSPTATSPYASFLMSAGDMGSVLPPPGSKSDASIRGEGAMSDFLSQSGLVSNALSRGLSRRTSFMSDQPIPEQDVEVDEKGRPSYWPAVKMELYRTMHMAFPLLVNNVANFSVSIIVLSYVGHLGPEALACTTLGGSLFNVLGQSIFIGCATTLETLCGQAVGAGRYRLLGLETLRCMVVMTLTMPFFVVLYAYTDKILLAMGQDYGVATGSARYLSVLSPALWLQGMTESLKRALTAQGIVLPNMLIALFTTGCTPFYSWLFVTYFDQGFVGAAYAISAGYSSNLLCFLGVTIYHLYKSHGTPEFFWPGLTMEIFQELPRIIRIAFPTTMLICLDWWTWETMILLAGLLPRPDVSVAVMGLGFNVVALFFMIPMSITGTSAIGIANFLGANQPKRARLAQAMGIVVCLAIITVVCAGIYVFRNEIGSVYTDDPDVLGLLCEIMPLISIILWCDALQNIWTAALRGAGRQSIGAGISLSMLWFFGVPLAITLAFHYKIGVIGMWYGLLTAFVLQAVVMVTTVLSTINMDKEADKAQQRLLERSFSIGEDGLGHLEAPLLVGEEEGLPPAP
uniref:Protein DETOXIFICATION n=1 Tax=Tetraselmis sp. GSL018 TaxID=582737 RepID=A0A061R8C4_9CHLO|mmetsp:Transcript_15910/g.37706  ORF Transcript_15910/g.37706 Transcript_15910/m.37706 type:complete len:617 (-) Transcript_15910:278-2128(-)